MFSFGKASSTSHNLHSAISEKSRVTIAIAGGGAGGVGAALELANAGYSVYLYEKKSELLSATSNKTPGRAGHGYHYIHKKTAELYLSATIEVVKRYQGCLIGDGHPETHYLRHGLYCIMKQKSDLREDQAEFSSIYSKEQILENYEAIKEYYRFLVTQDPSNKVFGEPDDFHRILSATEMEQYRETINLDIVDAIIDTREELLNWPKLRKILIDEINSHPNIRAHVNATIDHPRQQHNRVGFEFMVNGRLTQSDFFINATWEGIENLNQKIYIHMQPESRTNRLKTIIKAKLPVETQHHPSVFFCMGPHAMISNMGDGTVMSTYAQVTNVSLSTELFISEKAQQCLDGVANIEEEISMANQIIDGVSHYFPKMRNARIINKGYGIIKTRGTVDLFDPKSEVNKREELGVEEQLIGWIDNACMKLLHFLLNGKEILDLIEKSIKAKNIIEHLSECSFFGICFHNDQQIYASAEPVVLVKISILKNVLLMTLQRYSSTSDYTLCDAETEVKSAEKIEKLRSSLFTAVKAKREAMLLISSSRKFFI